MTAASSSAGRSRSSSRAAGVSRISTGRSSARSRDVPRRRESLVVLGILGQYPMAGVSWQAIHYLLGFQQLGWDVWYVEDSGAPPYDPRLGMNTEDCAHAVGYIADVMRRIGLPDRWAYVDLMHGATHGLPRARLDGLYR